MHLFNIRLGHACNSSSTHSIVILPNPDERKDIAPDGWSGDTSYNWENFRLFNKEAKLGYLAYLLNNDAAGMLTREEVDQLLEIVGMNGVEIAENVDHQSVWPMPKNFRGQGYNFDFLKELAAFFAREDVGIYGGHDNLYDEANPHKSREEMRADLFDGNPGSQMLFRGGERVRRDTDGKDTWWTLYSPGTGNKVRMTFENPLADAPGIDPKSSQRPELVDMKITGYCPFAKDCGWCYMDSNTEGQHARLYDITGMLDALAEESVFEVALGGGETTMHPDFIQILRHGHENGITMNFTTKNFAHFTSKKYAPWRAEVAKCTGAIAFSVNNRKDFERFKKMMEAEPFGEINHWDDNTSAPQITMQCIPAVCPTALFEEMLEYCTENWVRLTLLGFKRVGRGKEYTEPGNLRWMKTVEKFTNGEPYRLNNLLAVDTVMAADCKAEFDKLGVDPVWYHLDEGAFSCYIDATTMRLGASSFTDDSQMVQLEKYADDRRQEILDAYGQMQSKLTLS
jgi:hypothetical protein